MTRRTTLRRGQLPPPLPETKPEPTPQVRPPEPDVTEVGHVRLAEDDLMALADMDPSEFASVMGGNLGRTQIEIGDQVSGQVSRVGKDTVFVDLGAKAEGQLDLGEIPGARPGDTVTAYVIGLGDWGVALSQRLSGAAAAAHLEQARLSEIPITGKVLSKNPGGFEVRVGTAYAFCPISQIDRLPGDDLDRFVGMEFEFLVLETDEKVVLSRRRLQESQLDVEAVWQRLEPDQTYEAVVVASKPYGVFADVDGVRGLIPARELGWERVEPNTYKRGQRIDVRVLDVDVDRGRLTLSLRDPSEAPWGKVGQEFVPGGIYPGRVAGTESWGVFVELAPGLQGLVHHSRTGGRALPSLAEPVQVRLDSVDMERQRLELSLVSTDGAALASTGSTVRGTVAEVLRNGALVELEDGRTAWLPSREADLPPGVLMAQRFRRGRSVEVRILEVDPKRDRPVLTLKAEDSAASWTPSAATAGQASGSFGTLGDLLRQKLK